jgi:hypothetical protein
MQNHWPVYPSVRGDHAMDVSEYAILSVLIAVVVASIWLGFRGHEF